MEILRRTSIFLLALAVLIGVSFWIITCYRAHQLKMEHLDTRGHILPRQEWPEELNALFQDAKSKKTNLGDVKVYHGFKDDYFWKSETGPALIDLMISRWRLSRVDKEHQLVHIAFERMPSDISSPSQNDVCEYFVSGDWLEGEKGFYCCVLNNRTQKQVTVRYYYNW